MSGRPIVLDCSVLVKAITLEALSDPARALLASGRRLLVPDLMPIELGNVLWKKVRNGSLTAGEALEAQQALCALAPLRVLDSRPYQARALELALAHDRSFYDALYLAMAELERAIMVTADERLCRALTGTPLAGCLHWLGGGPVP